MWLYWKEACGWLTHNSSTAVVRDIYLSSATIKQQFLRVRTCRASRAHIKTRGMSHETAFAHCGFGVLTEKYVFCFESKDTSSCGIVQLVNPSSYPHVHPYTVVNVHPQNGRANAAPPVKSVQAKTPIVFSHTTSPAPLQHGANTAKK